MKIYESTLKYKEIYQNTWKYIYLNSHYLAYFAIIVRILRGNLILATPQYPCSPHPTHYQSPPPNPTPSPSGVGVDDYGRRVGGWVARMLWSYSQKQGVAQNEWLVSVHLVCIWLRRPVYTWWKSSADLDVVKIELSQYSWKLLPSVRQAKLPKQDFILSLSISLYFRSFVYFPLVFFYFLPESMKNHWKSIKSITKYTTNIKY